MTIEQAIKRLDERLVKLQKSSVLKIAASTAHAEYITRIFERGENTSGGQIGQYDDSKEMWADPSTLPRQVSPRSKPGSTKQAKKTTYFRSYKALRGEVGRESGFVNLRLTNDLQSDLANSPNLKQPQITEINKSEYGILVRRQINRDKITGIESKYGRVFGLSKDEVDLFNKTVLKEFQLINA